MGRAAIRRVVLTGFGRPRTLAFTVAVSALASLITCALVYAAGAKTGRLLFATDSDGASDTLEIAVMNPNGRGFRKLTHLPSPGLDPAWTSDGRGIIFLTDDTFTGRDVNWRMRSDGRRRKRLPGEVDDPVASSGRFVALLGARIRIVTAEGRKVRTLPWRLRLPADGYDSPAAAWSPDGRYLAVDVVTETSATSYSWVFVIATDGRSGARVLTPKKNDRGAFAEAWSPNSRRLLIHDYSGKKDVWYTVAPDGTRRHRLPSLNKSTGRFAWSPDSREIAYVGKDGGIFEVSEAGSPPQRLVKTRSGRKGANEVFMDWSSRGELAFSDIGGLYVVRSNGRGLRRLTQKEGAPDWSPDGKRLVFSQEREIFVVGRRRRDLRQLVRSVWDDVPQWSPDGQRIAFVRGRQEISAAYGRDGASSSARVYVMAADGRNQREIARGYGPRWSPDGRRLAFVRAVGLKGPFVVGRPQNGRVVVADIGSRVTREIGRGSAPAWSPTGDRLAFMRYAFRRSDSGRGWEVHQSVLLTVRSDGSDVRELNVSQLDDGGAPEAALYDPQWSPDGRTIAARAFGSSIEGGGLELIDAETGTIRKLDAEEPGAFEWSPDGSRIVFTQVVLTHAVALVDVATGLTRVLAKSSDSYQHGSPTWSSDGSQVGFIRCNTVAEPEACDVYTVSASGSRPKRLTRTLGIETSLDWG